MTSSQDQSTTLLQHFYKEKATSFLRNSPIFIVSFQGSILYTECILSFAVMLAALKVVSCSVAHLQFMV